MHESEKWKWSHSVMSDSSRLHGLQPTRLLHPWDFPGKSTGVGCHACAQSCPTLCNPMDCGSSKMGFPRQEYWSGLAFPSPGDLPDPGIELASLVSSTLAGGFFTMSHWESHLSVANYLQFPPELTAVKSRFLETLLGQCITHNLWWRTASF